MLELRNPAALAARPVQELFIRAFEGDRFSDVGEVLDFLVGRITDEDLGVFIARHESGEFVGMAIVSNHRQVFAEHPWLVHFYCAGGRSVALRLSERVHDWLTERGATSLRVLNQTGRSDEAHMMFFSPVSEGKVIGGVIEYEITSRE